MLNQWLALAFVLLAGIVLAIYGIRNRNKSVEFHKYPVFDALSSEVGHAAEEGSIIHVALGNGSLFGEAAMTSVAALQGLDAMIDLAAAYDMPPVLTTGDPTLYLLATDWVRRAYARRGNLQRFRPTLVRFIASNPVSYAAMAATYMFDGGIGSTTMLGDYTQEISLIVDASVRCGIYSAGGTTSLQSLGALYPSFKPDQLLMGEELFSGGAAVSDNPIYKASLGAQDFLRILVVISILVVTVLSSLGII
ncbi:MAG: hypothetical protein JW981_02540 [Anaerolineae bacterium]|nr:hypothetical protein [Anaerolineae bacterium]